MEEKKRIQISFNVDKDLHTRIKIRAALRNISMNLWLIRVIYKALKEEERL